MSAQLCPSPVRPGECSPADAERLISEGLISLPDASAMLPPVHGRPTSVIAIVRWCRRGKSGINLEAVRLHGEWWTSKPALARFVARVTAMPKPR